MCLSTDQCTFIITSVSLSEFIDKRSHMYLINLVFPQPVSPINTTGILHLSLAHINLTSTHDNVIPKTHQYS